MSTDALGLIELLFIFGVALALGVRELRALRSPAPSSPPAPPAPPAPLSPPPPAAPGLTPPKDPSP